MTKEIEQGITKVLEGVEVLINKLNDAAVSPDVGVERANTLQTLAYTLESLARTTKI